MPDNFECSCDNLSKVTITLSLFSTFKLIKSSEVLAFAAESVVILSPVLFSNTEFSLVNSTFPLAILNYSGIVSLNSVPFVIISSLGISKLYFIFMFEFLVNCFSVKL